MGSLPGWVLITGRAGFVGSTLAIRLCAAHRLCDIITTGSLRRTGSELTLVRLRRHGPRFMQCDVRNPEDLRLHEPPVDVVSDCSTDPSASAARRHHSHFVVHTHLLGTANLLELAREHRAEFVFLLTSRVYPAAERNSRARYEATRRFEVVHAQRFTRFSGAGVSESLPLEGALSSYLTTTLASQRIVEEYRALFDLRFVINRCGVIAGPWQIEAVEQGFVGLGAAHHVAGREISHIGWVGHGKQVRESYIDNLAEQVDHEIFHRSHLPGETLNISGSASCSLLLDELTEKCQKLTGSRVPISSVQAIPEDDSCWYMMEDVLVAAGTDWLPRRFTQQHAGAELYGLVTYLMNGVATSAGYTVFRYKGKQVPEDIQGASLVRALLKFFKAVRRGEAYDMGGSPCSRCYTLEAIAPRGEITVPPLEWAHSDSNRRSDHMWYVNDTRKFHVRYPKWCQKSGLRELLDNIQERGRKRGVYLTRRGRWPE